MTRRVASASPIALVAARAGVSIATVSRVVNGVPNKASAATVQRVQQAIAALDYRPVSAGRALRERRSRLVALLAPNLANPAMAAIAASIEDALRQAGLVMVLCDTHDEAARQDEYLAEMRAQRVRAVVLAGVLDSPGLRSWPDEVPLLCVNRSRPDRPGPFVGVDHYQAGLDAAAFFIERDLPVLGVLHGAIASSATAARVAGFRDGLGGKLGAAQVRTKQGAEHIEIGLSETPALLRRAAGPAGIFCSSDLIAYGAHHVIARRGAPVTLLGFDDNPLNDWLAPWLSSVRVPYSMFGAAVAAAIDRMERGQAVSDIILPHRLISRG